MVDLDPIWAALDEPVPGVSGVYFLFDEERIVYVGMATSPCIRVAAHREDEVRFTEALVYPVPNRYDRKHWEAAFIAYLRPPLNRTNVRRQLTWNEERNLRIAGFPVREEDEVLQ